MDIKAILFFAVFLGGFIFSSKGNTSKNRKHYIIFMMVLFTMESCLRGLSVGPDTANYWYSFHNDGKEEWRYIWQAMIERYIDLTGTEDIGFKVYNKIIYMIWPNFSFLLFISALTFFVPFGVLLNKYTKDFSQLIFIFVLYITLFNMIAMSGVRKEIALGFTVWAFIFYVDNNYKKCAICVFLGTMIHMTTLLFLLIPFIGLFKKRLRLLHISSFALIPIVIAFSGSIITLLAETSGNEKYLAYGKDVADGGAVTFTLLMEAISLFCLYVFRKIDLSKQTFMSNLYIVLPCFTFFVPLITNNGSMIRISQYFHLYIVLLLPYAIDLFFGKNNRNLMYIVLIMVLLILSYSSGYDPYTFIWNDNQPRY